MHISAVPVSQKARDGIITYGELSIQDVKTNHHFRDVSQLHFDPTKDEHSQFEIKAAQKPVPEKTEKKK